MLTVSILVGLRASLIVVYFALAIRVLFHWSPRDDDQKVNPRAVRMWWRWTWFLFSAGMILISSTRLSVIYPAYLGKMELLEMVSNPVLAFTAILGLSMLNVAGCMAQAGFAINKGAPLWIVYPVVTIPAWFVAIAVGLGGG